MATKRPINLEKMVKSILIYSIDDVQENIKQLDVAIAYLRQKRLQRRDASNFSVAAVRAVCQMDNEIGIDYGYRVFEKFPDERGFRTLVSYLWTLNRPEEALVTLKKMGSSDWKREKLEKLVHWISRLRLSESKKTIADIEFREKIQNLGNKIEANKLQINDLNRIEDYHEITVACILDEFSFNSFKYEANFVQLSVDSYIDELEILDPDFIFIESAWRGKDGLWGSKVGHASSELIEILDWASTNHAPTAFWNKEDPVHFNSFLNVAKLFEYVFTTDIDCIHRYKSALNHGRVYLLPFAFQPTTSNPIEKYPRKEGACFAGAYYHKYPERSRDLSELILSIRKVQKLEIYDRNYEKDIPEFKFPEEFNDLIIGTLPFEKIDLAYKGYNFGLNLNSIKQSQSMFARRVFELVACNTTVISNYSRGVRLFFGDHVISCDNGPEVVKKLDYLKQNPDAHSRLKASALRDVLKSHTYGERFRYIVSKISDNEHLSYSPKILVFSLVNSESQLDSLLNNYSRQEYTNTQLLIFTPDNLQTEEAESTNIKFMKNSLIDKIKFEDMILDEQFVCMFDTRDYYGPNYLLDLILSTQYTSADIITKATYYSFRGNEKERVIEANPYTGVKSISTRKSMFTSEIVKDITSKNLIDELFNPMILSCDKFSIDEYNYCQEVPQFQSADTLGVDVEIKLPMELPFQKLLDASESILPTSSDLDGEYFSPVRLFEEFSHVTIPDVDVDYIDGKTTITSKLDDGKHIYLYWPKLLTPDELGFVDGEGKFYFDTTPGLRLMLAVIFTDYKGNKIDSSLSLSNSNMTVKVPSDHCMIKLGLRIYSSGSAILNSLDMFHHDLSPQKIIGMSDTLILTNHYPSYDDIYRNGFIHSRVRDYILNGIKPDIFKLRPGEKISFSEFESVDIISGSQKALHRLLESGNYKRILVHFLDEIMWNVLKNYSSEIDIVVWVHGSEIQPWHRRKFNYNTDEELRKAKINSQKRMDFWVPLLSNLPKRMKLVFVSGYFAKEVMEDTGITLNPNQYSIIHNPIDTGLFNYVEKDENQRTKVLSIRPYASQKYANDLTVKAILELSKSKYFQDMEFMIVGAGRLFDEILEPIREFDNVKIHEGFLTHSEIAELHKEYGIFMTPTRMDSQGVSRDEAMSSGLVPITNAVTAIPEFVDDTCGILAPGENFKSMAKGILKLLKDPILFKNMSYAAAERVRNQSSTKIIINKEMDLFNDNEESI